LSAMMAKQAPHEPAKVISFQKKSPAESPQQ